MGKWRKSKESKSNQYEGQYFHDKKQGYGVFKWASGNIYRGQYMNDEREGIGEMRWTDGSVYIGQWSRGIQHGYGKMIFPDGTVKEGFFDSNVYKGPMPMQDIPLEFLDKNFRITQLAPKNANFTDIEAAYGKTAIPYVSPEERQRSKDLYKGALRSLNKRAPKYKENRHNFSGSGRSLSKDSYRTPSRAFGGTAKQIRPKTNARSASTSARSLLSQQNSYKKIRLMGELQRENKTLYKTPVKYKKEKKRKIKSRGHVNMMNPRIGHWVPAGKVHYKDAAQRPKLYY
jgi:hypothetical protein